MINKMIQKTTVILLLASFSHVLTAQTETGWFSAKEVSPKVWLFLQNCNPLHEYLGTLEKQVKMLDSYTTLFPGHGFQMQSDFINDQVDCVKGILDKSLEARPYKSFAGDAMISTSGKANVAFNPGNL